MTRPRTTFAALVTVIVASVLLVGAGAAVMSRRPRPPTAGPIAAALVRFAAESGIESLVVRSDETSRGRQAREAALVEAQRLHVTVERDDVRAGPRDALLLLLSSPGQARAHTTIEHPGRGVIVAPWLGDNSLTQSQSQIIVARVRGRTLQLWTPADVAFLPAWLSQGHDHHSSSGDVRFAVVRSSLPVRG